MKSCKASIFYITICLLFVVQGCGIAEKDIQTSVFLSSDMPQYKLHRVVVLPFANDRAETSYILPVFCESLQKIQYFDVVAYPKDSQVLSSQNASTSDAIDAASLVKLANSFHAQGVIQGRITNYSPFPMTLGLKVTLISTYDGQVLWSADSIWQDKHLYSVESYGIENSLDSLSPFIFFKKGCESLVQTLIKEK